CWRENYEGWGDHRVSNGKVIEPPTPRLPKRPSFIVKLHAPGDASYAWAWSTPAPQALCQASQRRAGSWPLPFPRLRRKIHVWGVQANSGCGWIADERHTTPAALGFAAGSSHAQGAISGRRKVHD